MRGADLTYALGQYLTFSYSRDSRGDRERGHEDGLRGYPAASQEGLTPYEYQLIHQARADIDSYKSAVDDELDSLERDIAERRQKRNETYDGRRNDLSIRHKQDLEELRQSIGPAAPSTQDLQRKMTEASDRYEALARREGREVQLHFAEPLFSSPRVRFLTLYTLLLAILAAVELPLNIDPFLALLGTNNLISAFLVATLVGVLLVVLAHSLGILLRTAGRRSFWRALIGILLVLTLAMLLAYGMSVLRQSNLGVQDAVRGTLDTVSGAVGGTGPLRDLLGNLGGPLADVASRELEPQAFFQPLTKTGWVLLLINLGVFTVGTLLSFFRHDPNPQFEHAYSQREALGARLDAQMTSYEQWRAELESQYSLLRQDLAVEADRLANEIEKLKVEYEATETRAENDVAKVIDVIKQRVHAYQQGNLEGRGNEPAPTYFGEEAMRMVEREILRRPGTDNAPARSADVRPLHPV